MSTFTSIAETRRLGAPIVRLVRVALGRDPDPNQLLDLAARARAGETLADLTAAIVASGEFTALHGPDAPPGDRFIAQIVAQARGRRACKTQPIPPEMQTLMAMLHSAAQLGAGRADLVTTLAESHWGRAEISLLPGLAPGAPPDDPVAYALWTAECEAVPTGKAETSLPPVMILIGVGDGNAEAALRTVVSLRDQTHAAWELCLLTRLFSAWPRTALGCLPGEDDRIQLIERPAASAWQADLGGALASSRQPLTCMLDAGDTLPPHALGMVAGVFAADPDVQVVYTDEDVQGFGERRTPRFKPDFSPDTMLAGNAVGQLAVYRTSLLRAIGGVRPDCGADIFYDVALRAVRQAGRTRIRHLPFVLCHRAVAPNDWPAAADHPPRAAEGLLQIARPPGRERWPRIRFDVRAPLPLVSVIIPSRDRADLLAVATAGVLKRTIYPEIELIVVDNGSSEPDALTLLAELQADPRVRMLRRPGAFNFAALCNAAAAAARGDVLLLLNNDTEVIEADWLREMTSHAVRPDVGAVGARLLYGDGTLQHGGILLGPDGAATHVGRGAAPDDMGYDGQFACVRDLSAVTGACLAIRRAVWHKVGGMDERLAVTWNDIDLCLRVRHAGLRVVWTPNAVLRHLEGVTRGLEAADPARQARFRAEQDLIREKWGTAVDRDPFLNPNLLATEAGPLVLTRPRTGGAGFGIQPT